MASCDSPYDRFLSQKYFSSLDGLRCLSIVMVIWHHSGSSGAGDRFHGYLGFQLFFVISGFLITTLLLRERERTGQIALGKFYMRRTLRIFPLYYAVLLLYVALVLIVRPKTPLDWVARKDFFINLPYFATYTSNWFVPRFADNRIIFYFAWSLATEEQFYLFWPSVLRVSRRSFVPVIVAALLVVANQASRYLIRPELVQQSSLLIRIILSISTPILLGCILAITLERRSAFQVAYRFLGAKWSAPLALLMLLFAISRPDPSEDWVGVLMTWLVGSCCIREDHLLAPVFGNPVVRYIGKISYGMYLLHMLALNIVRRAIPQSSPVFFPLSLGLTIAAASVSFRVYEQPFLKLKNWFRAEPLAPDHAAEPEVPSIVFARDE